MVGESLKFMVLGMLVVFIFLALLVELMKWQAKIVSKYFPDKKVAPTAPRKTGSSADDAGRTAAIIAAIADFKKNKS